MTWDQWERDHQYDGDDRELAPQIDDLPEWDGDEAKCPCCGKGKPEVWDECMACCVSGRLRDFDRHPSAEDDA
jgi:hypothetical protein